MNHQLQNPNLQVSKSESGLTLIDTHCHIHESDYPLPIDDVLKRASEAGVTKMLVVGTSEKSSEDAVQFASKHPDTFATIGVHPHDTKDGWEKIRDLVAKSESLVEVDKRSTNNHIPIANNKIVAVGEIGLDYFYDHSPRDVQIKALESQIQTAVDNNLPIVFHVREAFDDFWPIFDKFHGLKGVLHSFTDSQENLEKAFERGLFVGVNGISTFTKSSEQQKMYANIPIERMLLETDAPFLAPASYRGSTNEPAYVVEVARHHAELRGIDVDELARVTTRNAERLFGL